MHSKVIMDTNVPTKAATAPQDCKEEELDMQNACMEYVKNFVYNKDSKLVLDVDYEIQREYENRIPHNTNIGKIFWKWFYTYVGKIKEEDFIKLERTPDGDYVEFPLEERTKEFDRSDRKFVALAMAHEEHPAIIEAADGKWLGFKDVFEEYGVHINFLDMAYAEMMYDRKITNKGRS